MTPRIRLAKAVMWCAGVLSYIKTPHRVHRLVSTDPFETEPAGLRWLSCELSMSLHKLSARIDPWHWDHWALVHDDCSPRPCPDCGGGVCRDES